MKMEEIRQKNEAELHRLLEDLRRESYNLRIQARTGQLQHTARPGEVRKAIARVLTELKNRTAVQA